MSIPVPELDSRTFKDLVDEALARIPRYTPEWTNFNDSDPGMTLVQLHAWLAETILHELNRVPELNYVKFLNLLGIVPNPDRPARAELTFVLDKLDNPADPLVVPVPIRTKVAVDDPDLPREVVFETDRTLNALNAHVAAVFAHSGDAEHVHALVTRYEEGLTWLHSFAPFDPARIGAAGDDEPAPMLVGLLLRPAAKPPMSQFVDDRLPAGPLDLWMDAVQVYDTDPGGAVIHGPLSTRCSDVDASPPLERHVTWQLWTGGLEDVGTFHTSNQGWTTLAVSHDETLGLVRSGHVVLELPTGATPLDPTLVDAEFWAGFGHARPPRTQSELEGMLRDPRAPEILPGLVDVWATLGVDDPDDLAAFAACGESASDTADKIHELPEGTLHPDRLTFEEWTAISEDFAIALPLTDGRLRPLHWLRARVTSRYADGEPRPSVLRGVHLNTVPATQAATRLEDELGRSSGRPSQTFTAPRAPVLIDPLTGHPDLVLQVGPDVWERQDDFLVSGPDDPHYLLDPGSGVVTLGDGEHGRVPVADTPVVIARYRTGGGLIGNVPSGTITKIKGRLRGVKAVTNPRAAHDGSNAETLEAVKLRAPRDVRTRDRAVTAADFADLAKLTPGVTVHTAYAIPRRAATDDGSLVDKDGAVTVVILPANDEPSPQPAEAQLRAVCQWLEPRRLVTTEVHVVGPRYSTITQVGGRFTVRADHDLSAVKEAVYAALLTYLHPLRGGADGTGWPFGTDIYHGAIYDVILAVEGVVRVQGLTLTMEGATPGVDTPPDVTAVPDGHLPTLARSAIALEPSYD